MRTRYAFSTILMILLRIHCTACLLDPISIGGIVAAASGLYGVYWHYNMCKTNECCDENWIPIDVYELDRVLGMELHGQEIARATVVRALRGYVGTPKHPKALALSFHGLPGCGKNFVARHIAQLFYKKGINSEYYHFFNGRSFAPDESRIPEYKETIQNTIVESLSKCEKSMFVFDEVDMMPEGVLNVLVPILDYNPSVTLWRKNKRVKVNSTKAIFIFLSNTGSKQIMEQMLHFWTHAKSRQDMTLKDFENLITIGAFNEKGGFRNSDTIGTSLIDYYVPFLPLTEEHARLCMKDAFKYRNVTPTPEMEEDVLSVVTYGPEPHNLFSKSGCKRIEQKVISLSYLYNKSAFQQ